MDTQEVKKLVEEDKTLEAQQIILDALASVDWKSIVDPMTIALIEFSETCGKTLQEIIDSIPEWIKVFAALDYEKTKRREMYYRRYARHGKK